MKDEAKGEVQIYEFFSECLKLFKKKIILLCKISNCADQEIVNQYETSLKQLIRQSSTLLQTFQEIQTNSRSMQLVFSRFLLRVRQSIHNFSMKSSSEEVTNFLGFLEKIVKQYSNGSQQQILLKIILLKVPKYSLSPLKNQKINMIKNQSQKKVHLDQGQEPKQKTKIPGKSAHFDLYDKYLSALEQQYRLFDCLNIDQSHYRRTFFLALEDTRRKDNNLVEDMMNRNMFVKQSLDMYQRSYQNSKRRLNEKKQKLLKSQLAFSSKQLQNKKSEDNFLKIYKQKFESNKNNFISAPKRLRTDYTTQKPPTKQPSFHLKTMVNFKQKPPQHPKPFSPFIPTQPTLSSIPQPSASFVSSLTKNSAMIPLKKIQFLGTKIQLGPQQISKKIPILDEEQRHKRIYNRTQQHVRKKISFMATQNKNYQPKMAVLRQSREARQSRDRNSREKGKKQWGSIWIANCKIHL